MTPAQLQQYDRFLDENDWDIYYWATQEPPKEGSEASETSTGTSNAPSKPPAEIQRRPGEWAQTVGTFKPAYRPVPQRWKDSEILVMLRQHVKDRSSDGVLKVDRSVRGGGLGFMPPIKNFN
jgi:hypothetical protein